MKSKVVLLVMLFISVTATLSAQNYVELQRELDGSFAEFSDKIYFIVDEPYNITPGTSLDYKVYSNTHVAMSSLPNASYNSGRNYIEIDFCSITGFTNNNFYILEVKNSKGELRKVRFKFNYTFNCNTQNGGGNPQ